VRVLKGATGTVKTEIAATPETVYDLVSDVSRMGEWSPECVAGEWLDGATGPAVGARFRGKNRHGLARWSNKPRVAVADRGKEFAFVANFLWRDMTRWTYHFEPAGDGTQLTESFELLRSLPFYLRWSDRFLMGVKDRPADLQDNMRRTLAKIKLCAETDATSNPACAG
jgi:hypothetical protein